MKLEGDNNEGYDINIPRVSSIVSFVYPFKGNSKQRYLDWLKKNDITEEEYLGGANELGTFIHKQLESFILGNPIDRKNKLYQEVKDEIRNGVNYLKQFKKQGYKLISEIYLIDHLNRYQGTSDLILVKDGEIIIADFKSFGVVKKRYGMENKNTVDKDKREKVRLQLSLYAWAYLYHNNNYRCSKVKLIYVHSTMIREYDMEILSKEEIDKILNSYSAYNNFYDLTF